MSNIIEQKDLEGLEKSISKLTEVCTDNFASFDSRMKALEEFKEQGYEDLYKRLENIEAKGSNIHVSLPGVEDENKKNGGFSFLRLYNSMLYKDATLAPFEQEVVQEARRKAIDSGSGGANGAALIPEQFVRELIEVLRANVVALQAGATVLGGLQGSPVRIPKIASGVTAAFVAENTTITANDPNLGDIQMTPHQLACLVKMSNRFNMLSFTDAETMLRNDMARAMAEQWDISILRGDGTAENPEGILNITGVDTTSVAVGTNGGRYTFDHAEEQQRHVAGNDALRGALGYIMHPFVGSNLKRQKVVPFSGATAEQSDYTAGLPMTDQMLANALGLGFFTTTQIPTNLTKGTGTTLSEVYFGNWNEVLIGNWGGLQFAVTGEAGAAFESNQTWLRVIQEVDVNVRHTESFQVLVDAESDPL
jgi:HK97 family phage major capsid protein